LPDRSVCRKPFRELPAGVGGCQLGFPTHDADWRIAFVLTICLLAGRRRLARAPAMNNATKIASAAQRMSGMDTLERTVTKRV
jgi:hypothetical protein